MTRSAAPPGPKGSLLGGNLSEFRRDRLDFLTRCARTYGDFVSLRLGPRRVILVSDPDAIEHVLVTAGRHFVKHFALRMSPLILGNGLLTSEGDFWLRQRRLAQPAFQRGRVAGYAGVMVDYAERMLAGWRAGEPRDLLAEMSRLTLAIAAKTLFDADADDKANAVRSALEVSQQHFIRRFNSLVPIPVSIPTPGNLRLRRAVRQLDVVIYEFIRQRRAGGAEKGDLLSMLLHARDEGDGGRMTDRQLRDEAMTLFLAGHETTALALSWTWFLLATHPEAEARLLEELRGALGGRAPTVEDWPRLKYTERVVTEAMRLYPPAYVIGREATSAVEVGGYTVPKGMTLLMSQWVVHRDPRWYESPEKFRPERWEGERAKALPKYAYFPFGGGPRLCIGNTFALMEAVLVVATIAQRFRFRLVPGQTVEPSPTFTLRPQSGIKVVLEGRS
jgi:cytochrome P450